ncbi:MAG TPA: ABC transporter permease, partial [Cyclobacteriaceae bacterium]
MIKNYLISAIRNIKRNFLFSAINILGLTVGLTFCFLIALFVANEYSYEAFNPDKFSIYRLNLKQFRTGNDSRIVGLTGWETGERVRTAIPDIDEMIRIRPFGNYLMKTEEKSIEVSQAVLAQDNFFTFFQIPLIKGEPNQVLMDATSVVLTEETAKALFGEEDPIGKIVTLKSSFELPLKVTGVARRMKNSHINYDAVIAWNASTNHGLINDWYKYSLYTYFRVNAQSVISQVAEKINVILNSGNDEDKQEAYLQSLDRIYLSSSQIEFAGSFNSGNPRNIRILIIAAGFILLIACVNYVNTNTSKATKRSREVGVR